MNNDQIILGNGNLTVYLDQNGLINDARFPAIDSINRMISYTKFNKIGVYFADAIHWLDDGTWDIKNQYYPGRLIVKTTAVNAWLKLAITIDTFVDYDLNVLCRSIKIHSTSGVKELSLFVHSSFQLGESVGDIDSAHVLPRKSIAGIDAPLILHQGSAVQSLVGLRVITDTLNSRTEVSCSVGRYGQYDGRVYSGAWADAADGLLSNNTSDLGNTDSVLQADLMVGEDDVELEYFVGFADNFSELTQLAHRYNMESYSTRARKTSEFWVDWLKEIAPHIKRTTSAQSRAGLVEQLITLKANTMTSGAINIDGGLIDPRLANSSVVSGLVMSEVALAYTRIGNFNDAYRVLNFLDQASDGQPLYPTYYANGTQGPSPYNWSVNRGIVVPPISATDIASLLAALTETIVAVHDENIVGAQWRKLWRGLGQRLANQLVDLVVGGDLILTPTGRPHNIADTARTIDIVAVYHALRRASELADIFSETSNVIKFGSAADDIIEYANSLWNESEGRFYDGPNILTTNDSDLVIDYIDRHGVDLFTSEQNQLARDNVRLRDFGRVAAKYGQLAYFVPLDVIKTYSHGAVIESLVQINQRLAS